MSLSILLRDGDHGSGTAKPATNRFALQAATFSFTMTKTPIQIPIPQNRPQLVDLGVTRPNISISGVIDTVGLPDLANNSTHYLQTLDYTLYNSPTSNNQVKTFSTQTYYIPYKNVLEDFVYYVHFSSLDTPIQLEVLGQDPPVETLANYHTKATGLNHTGGAIYNVAIQNASFTLAAGKENRYDFSLSFVATTRLDQYESASSVEYNVANYSIDLGNTQASDDKAYSGSGDGSKGAK